MQTKSSPKINNTISFPKLKFPIYSVDDRAVRHLRGIGVARNEYTMRLYLERTCTQYNVNKVYTQRYLALIETFCKVHIIFGKFGGENESYKALERNYFNIFDTYNNNYK